MMNLFSELGIEDRLQWKVHKMIFAMQELPGEFTTFNFIPGIPAPFNFGLAILLNQKMLTLQEKIQTAPPLLPMLIEGQVTPRDIFPRSLPRHPPPRPPWRPCRRPRSAAPLPSRRDWCLGHCSRELTEMSARPGGSDLPGSAVLPCVCRALPYCRRAPPYAYGPRASLWAQAFIDEQDELSVLEFMRKYGMPERINEEVFISMAKALDFIDPDKLSMTVVLTAMNRFLNEDDGLQMAFLDGNQPDRLCAPMKAHIEARGGEVRTSAPVKEILTNADGSCAGLAMRDGSTITADMYVSAMPVDILKRMTPEAWQTMPYFRQADELEGIPVINIHMWFDRKLKNVDHLCFSRSPLLSVYADMSTTCKEYYDEEASMLELVFAPCSPLAGGNVNWIAKTDEEIIDATMGELARLFPTEIASDPRWPATAAQGPGGQATLRKFAVVKVPRSVYAAIPGRNKYRPSQETPIDNFVLAGDWTSQKFLGSMEGALLGGKLAAEVIVDKALGQPTKPLKEIRPEVVAAATAYTPKPPPGVKGEGAIAFGGGAVLSDEGRKLLAEVDAVQFDTSNDKAPAEKAPAMA